MTAEIAVMNTQGIALAADSAATRRNKISKSANKIFSLSKYAPVGMMIFSRSAYRGIPWETIIKLYRDSLGHNKFDTLKEYANDFFTFLSNNPSILQFAENENIAVLESITDFIGGIKSNLLNIIDKKTKEKGGLSKEEVINTSKLVFERNFEMCSEIPEISIRKVISMDEFKRNFSMPIDIGYKEIQNFEGVVEGFKDKYISAVYNLITSEEFPAGYSGIVFAGYGEQEIFPSVQCFKVGDSILNNVQSIEEKYMCLDDSCRGRIIPFAQIDMIAMFMEGIHEQILRNNYRLLSGIFSQLSEKLVAKFSKNPANKAELEKYFKEESSAIIGSYAKHLNEMQAEFSSPIMEIVGGLQPQELAKLSETLVNLTSIKREMSWDQETVAGPIDVAVITKGDGLIWIKRKHYFDGNLNHHFFANYFRSSAYEKE